MLCPHCQSPDNGAVLKTECKAEIDEIRRTRVCKECGNTYYTVEILRAVRYYDKKTLKSKVIPIKEYENNWERYNQ